jgi:dienelactone hydrolase
MKHHLLMTTAAVAGLAAALIVLPTISAAETPPMSGGYTNVIAIPVPENDPQVRAVAGALFKPEGKGPFPAIIYMSGCAGLGIPPDVAQQKAVIDHYVAEHMTVLILDSLTPRGMPDGVCERGTEMTIYDRRADDAYSAQKALAAMPDIDAKRIFLQGYSHGANAATLAVNPRVVEEHGGAVFAGVVAYYPYCVDKMAFAAPTLILVGEKDDWTPAALCKAIMDRPNLDLMILPGQTHGFTMPLDKPVDFLGHHIVYDAQATAAAQTHVDAFIAMHMK